MRSGATSSITFGFGDEALGQPQQGCHVDRVGKLQELSAVAFGHARFARIEVAPQRPQPFQIAGVDLDPTVAENNEQKREIVKIARLASAQAIPNDGQPGLRCFRVNQVGERANGLRVTPRLHQRGGKRQDLLVPPFERVRARRARSHLAEQVISAQMREIVFEIGSERRGECRRRERMGPAVVRDLQLPLRPSRAAIRGQVPCKAGIAIRLLRPIDQAL